MNNHSLFDKRQKKPRVYRVAEFGEDYTLQQIEKFEFGKSTLQFITPNFVALSMSSHFKSLRNAKKIYQELIKPKQSVQKNIEFNEHENIRLYDYFEYIQMAIISITTAVEALTNALIPDDFILEDIKDGQTIQMNKTEIERTKSIVVKLKKVIPKALSCGSPTRLKSWTKFTQLIDLRNDLIHLKSFTLSANSGDRHIIAALLNEKVFNKVNAASQFIIELEELISFHYEYPVLRNTEDLHPIKIEKWSEVFKVIEK